MDAQLTDTLVGIGKPPTLLRMPDGATLLILAYGGRALGLYTADSAENFLWTHPALSSATTAADFYAGAQWHNSGGERTWLAPEVDFFFPEFPRTDKYFQPRQLDPGQWQLTVDGDRVQLVNRLACRLSRTGAEVSLVITKTFTPARNPLRDDGAFPYPDAVRFAGYTTLTRLEIVSDGAASAGPVGLWNLLQLPHGGVLYVPTYYSSAPRVLFGEVSPDDVDVREREVRFAMRAAGEHKVAWRATAVTGRVGYRYAAAAGQWALVVRNLFVDPSGWYVDVPWGDTNDLGYVVQACNIHSALGRFSELEYHAPAIGAGTGRTAGDDVSQTWAFRGPREDIGRIMGRLLTPAAGDAA